MDDGERTVPDPGASDGRDEESQWTARAAAQVKQTARRAKVEPLSVVTQFVGANPRVLSNVFAVRLAADLRISGESNSR
jgi:hypothetical protein